MLKRTNNANPLLDELKCHRIEICGGMASGKTTLASLLKLPAFGVIFENFQASPFLEAFYQDRAKYTFETEVSFLLLHYHQIKKESHSRLINVCDFSITQDFAYAKMGLHGSKLQAFGAVYNEVNLDIGRPQLLVHLKCDAQTELQRIRKRAREIETSITIEFLENLNSVIEREVASAQEHMQVISIDSTALNFADDEATKKEVTAYLQRQLASSLSPPTTP